MRNHARERIRGGDATFRLATSRRHCGSGFVGDPDAGVFAHPTVVEGIRPGDALYDTETFGPLVGLGRFSSLDEAIELVNSNPCVRAPQVPA